MQNKTGTLSIQVTSVSVPSRGLGADSGGSAPVWARVRVARSTESWINTAAFSAEVGWREKEETKEAETAEENGANENTEEKKPTGPFAFWPAPLPDLLPAERGEDVGENDEVPKQEPSWSWTAVSHVTPDVVRNAPADAASSVWEQTLATLSEEDVARADIEYLYPQYNGAAPQRSGPIPLTRHHVTAVLNSSIVVEVYRGSDRNPETDTLVGRAAFGSETWENECLVGGENGMARVLTYTGGVNIELPLEAPVVEPNEEGELPAPAFSEPATVGLCVSADDTLLEYCLGSRVFTCLVSGIPMCDNVGAIAVPSAWKIPCTAGEVKESDGAWEALTFSIACDLPNAEGTAAEMGQLTGGTSRGFPMPVDSTSNVTEGSVENVAEGEGKETGAQEVPPPNTNPSDVTSMMVVSWSPQETKSAPSTLIRAFLPRSEVDALVSQGKVLQDFPTATPWTMLVTRSLFEGEGDNEDGGEATTTSEENDAAVAEVPSPSPATNYQVPVPIVTMLTEPGVANMHARFALADVTGIPSIETPDPNAVEEEVEEGDTVRRVVSKVGPELLVYVQFNAPLVSAPPPPPEPVLMPSDIVAARPAAPRAPPISAVNLLRSEVREAATSIVTEIYSLFGSDITSQSMSPDQRRRQLLYHLNTGGAYHALRERLKHSMGRLVKERFPAEAALAPGSVEHGKFVSELYVFLMEEVFSVINDMFAEGADGPTIDRDGVGEKMEPSKSEEGSGSNNEKKTEPSMLISSEANSGEILTRLGALAEEAEMGGDLDLALRYHQDRVVASEGAAERRHVRQVVGGGAIPWIDYAAFAARCGDFPKADECCREAIALSLPETATSTQSGDADPSALLMQSALMCRNGDQDMAKIMLSPMTSEDKADARACTMLSIIHLRCDRETKKAEKAMKRAVGAGGSSAEASSSRFDLYHDLASWLVCRGLGDMASFVLGVAAKEGRAGNDDNDASAADDATIAWTAKNMEREQRVKHLWLGGATALAAGDLDRAEALLRSAVEVEEGCGPAWSVLGHVLARKSDSGTNEAIDAFQTALPLLEIAQNSGSPSPALPVAQLGQLYNSLGYLYLQQGSGRNVGAAKEVYLRACKLAPTSTAWLGAGIAALELGKHAESEDALAEANILNNQNPQIWGYLALLCLQSAAPRVEEADQSLNQAVRLGLGDPTLLERIGASYATLGCYSQAESTLRRATGSHDSDSSRKLLGDVMAAQNKFEEALAEYETVLNSETTSENIQKEAAIGQTRMLEALGIGTKRAWK